MAEKDVGRHEAAIRCVEFCPQLGMAVDVVLCVLGIKVTAHHCNCFAMQTLFQVLLLLEVGTKL
jgi:hypothetical protein